MQRKHLLVSLTLTNRNQSNREVEPLDSTALTGEYMHLRPETPDDL